MSMNYEDEEFNRIEMESRIRKEAVLQALHNENERLGLYKDAYPEQEPVACVQDLDEVKRKHLVYEKGMDWKDPLYTTPPQRTWVGLTDEEIADCAEKMEASDPTDSFWREFFRGIEAKLKEKNT